MPTIEEKQQIPITRPEIPERKAEPPNLDVDKEIEKLEPGASKLDLDQLFNSMVNPKIETFKNPEQEKIKNSFIEVGNFIRKNYTQWFNGSTILLHTLGAMLPYVTLIPKEISHKIKKFAEGFSRWGVPLIKLHTGAEAIYGKRMFEGIARIAPTLFMPFLPFHNFQLAYGLSSGINVALEHIYGRTGDLKKEDGFEVNNKKVLDGLKSMVKDFFHSETSLKAKSKIGLALGGALGMLSGAIPTLLFDRNGLNDTFAKIFGSIRSIGGLMGDLSIILFSSQPTQELRNKEKVVGSFYLIPSIMDLAQRWINQDSDANEIFNHAKTALNTIAEVIWSNFSTDRNTKSDKKDSLDSEQTVFSRKPLYKNNQLEDILHLAS